jgi:hypothetical protein
MSKTGDRLIEMVHLFPAEASVVVRSIVVGALIVVRRFHQVDDVSGFVKPQ